MVANIWVAAADNQIELVQEYLRSGNYAADSKDENGFTPLHAAASYGHRDLLRLLVALGGNINVQDGEGDTPLHHTEDVDTAKLLVEELDADFRVKNDAGQTAAAFIEEEDENPELAQYLRSLAHGTPPPVPALNNLPSPGTVQGHQIRYSLEDELAEMDPEKRKKLEEIVNGENPEAALRELVTAAVRDGLSQYKAEEGDSKRLRGLE